MSIHPSPAAVSRALAAAGFARSDPRTRSVGFRVWKLPGGEVRALHENGEGRAFDPAARSTLRRYVTALRRAGYGARVVEVGGAFVVAVTNGAREGR